MLKFERTYDLSLVFGILTDPRIYPHVTDDFAPRPEQFRPIDHPSFWYVTVHDGAELLGLFLFEARGVCWEVHTCLLPVAWGGRAARAAKEMAEWLWKATSCKRVITNVPDYNRLALRFAEHAGMTRFGTNEKSYMKHGKLHDQIMLGLSRPEVN